MSTWDQGIDSEIRFWDSYLGSDGLEWPEDFERRTNPEAEVIESEILSRIRKDQHDVSILDVGSGPLTSIGFTIPGRVVTVTPVDALADRYSELLARHGISPPRKALPCAGEHLSDCFDANTFDFTYSRNALDHMREPANVVLEMLRVTKVNGWVILRHRPNEGISAGYDGLHGWNLSLEAGEFWIWNHQKTINMNRRLASLGAIASHEDGEWLVIAIRKLPVAQRPAALLADRSRRVVRRVRRHLVELANGSR